MIDRMDDRPQTSMVGPLVGFALGAVVGGAVALLMAPASGEKTRRQLGNAARHMGRDARHTMDEARESASEAVSDASASVKSALTAGRELFQKPGNR